MEGRTAVGLRGPNRILGTMLTRAAVSSPRPKRESTLRKPPRCWNTVSVVAGARCRTPRTRRKSSNFTAPSGSPTAAVSTSIPRAVLIWLEVDATIRKLTDDRRSIDDFCHAFYGGPDGEPVIKTYTFDDLVATLNGIAPVRLDRVLPRAPRLYRARCPARWNHRRRLAVGIRRRTQRNRRRG